MPGLGYLNCILLSLILSCGVCNGKITARIVGSLGSGPDGLAGDLIKRKSDWDLEEEKLFREREAEHQISTQRGDTDAEAVSYLREEMLCISAFFFLVIISRILSAKRQKRNVYIFKSNKWRDEYGYRVAVVASVLVESKKNDVAFLPSAPDKKKQANNSQSVEEDFWLLLMSEVEPPVEFTEGGIRKTKNVSKRKKPCKRSIEKINATGNPITYQQRTSREYAK